MDEKTKYKHHKWVYGTVLSMSIHLNSRLFFFLFTNCHIFNYFSGTLNTTMCQIAFPKVTDESAVTKVPVYACPCKSWISIMFLFYTHFYFLLANCAMFFPNSVWSHLALLWLVLCDWLAPFACSEHERFYSLTQSSTLQFCVNPNSIIFSST